MGLPAELPPALILPVIHSRNARLGNRIGAHHEAGESVARTFGQFKLFNAERIYGKDVSMHLAGRRAGAAETRCSIVVPQFQRAFRHVVFSARASVKLHDLDRNIHDIPMPPARTGRRVGIIGGDSKALGFLRCAGPRQLWRQITAFTAEALEAGFLPKWRSWTSGNRRQGRVQTSRSQWSNR